MQADLDLCFDTKMLADTHPYFMIFFCKSEKPLEMLETLKTADAKFYT